jgi:hypothetical protein
MNPWIEGGNGGAGSRPSSARPPRPTRASDAGSGTTESNVVPARNSSKVNELPTGTLLSRGWTAANSPSVANTSASLTVTLPSSLPKAIGLLPSKILAVRASAPPVPPSTAISRVRK